MFFRSCVFILFFPLVLYGFWKNKVQYFSYDWVAVESSHFEVLVTRGQTNLLSEAIELLETAYSHHQRLFNYTVKKKIQVILYPNQIDFLKNNILPWTERGTEGFTELSRGRVAIYFTPRRSEMKHFVYHELAHVFQLFLWSEKRLVGMQFLDIPLWVVEGGAEWASAGLTREGDRYVANLLYRGKIPSLFDLSDLRLEPYQYYLVYKMGALFYTFAEEKWGKGFFARLMHLIAEKGSWGKILREDLGIQQETLDREFREFLSRRYFLRYPQNAVFEKLHEKENFEAHMLWITSNEFLTMGVDRYYPAYVLYNTNTQRRKVLDRIGISEENLYFQYQRNHLSKSTNSLVCWLVEGGDRYRLVLYDTKTRKKTFYVPSYRVISSPEISPSGEEIVFVAFEGMHHILAIYHIPTRKTHVLFSTPFVIENPRWFDRDRILFSANFHDTPEGENLDLYLYDREQNRLVWRMDSGESDEMPYVFEKKGEKKILFIKQGFFPSLCVYDPQTELYTEISTAPGEISFPVQQGEDIYFTLYDGGTMAIYRTYYQEKEQKPASYQELPSFSEKSISEWQGLLSVKPYIWRIQPDSFFFIFSANSYGDVGLAGIFSGSDILGDHQVYALVDSIFVGADPGLAGWNMELGYAFLKYRHQFGFRFLHYNNLFYEWIQFPDFYQVGQSYFDKWQVDGLYSYPLNTFQRFDVTVSYRSLTYLTGATQYEDHIEFRFINAQELLGSGRYVFDNTLGSSIGPLDGLRATLALEQILPLNGLGGLATRLIGDLRWYFMIVPGYGFATRVVAGKIVNYDPLRLPQQFWVGGFQSIRGYPYGKFSGDTMLVINTEFRFPLIRYWQLGFPPIVLPTIWSVGFLDMGAVTKAEDIHRFQLFDDEGYLKDGLMSAGFGFRLVFGEDIKLMWNFAYPYDGRRFKEVVQEIVIARDF
ncbi:BamA/TamA family outer membrane protein [Thermospira aquatica]|uniref:BamA/TamA family outer membrane protein n=1 Tax=Thermospira aquatica TaxID=2828656 RepID=A0AAX3BG01_9SPIR|nr:BamA/TamA family outer membrane protein [Thermospira aquatica]URA11088.1 BamA/TamA family outer membrane protein [Thermospira aquatica]